jgi:hypothetical protein
MTSRFSSLELMETAVRTTGLNDFGDIVFEDGLNVLVDSINEIVHSCYDQAIQYLRAALIQTLANRLQVTELIRNHPEVLNEKIVRPMIITGLPRTGTTLLQTLIALDPACRYLRNWESAMAICPPPELLNSAADPRIRAYHEFMSGVFQNVPILKAINGINFLSGGTAECQNLSAHAFRNLGYCAGFGLRTYGEWLVDCDMRPGYQYHHLLLKVLQWRCPNERWVLKAPMHLFALDVLLNQYPDARIIFTHRDPVAAMASGSSLVYNWAAICWQHPDPFRIGEWFPKIWEKALKKALLARDAHSPEQFVDVFHQDLIDDPLAAVSAIYRHFGLEVSPGHRYRIKTWLRDNPRTSFGKHSYAPDDYGLDRAREEDRFGFYLDRFGARAHSGQRL